MGSFEVKIDDIDKLHEPEIIDYLAKTSGNEQPK